MTETEGFVKNIVVLAGDGEYESHRTMRAFGERIQAALHVRIEHRKPDVIEDMPDFPPSSFGDLSALESADLLILYTRFRLLPDSEIAAIAAYVERGGNILALRTANHAFQPVPGSSWFEWTTTFADAVLGSAWTRHHGHSSSTDVHKVTEHHIVGNVPGRFHVRSWLYEANPPVDATVLLRGEPIDPEGEPSPSPVAWIREPGDQRIFYTSLGSQADLEQEEVVALLMDAVTWCLHLDVVPERAS